MAVLCKRLRRARWHAAEASSCDGRARVRKCEYASGVGLAACEVRECILRLTPRALTQPSGGRRMQIAGAASRGVWGQCFVAQHDGGFLWQAGAQFVADEKRTDNLINVQWFCIKRRQPIESRRSSLDRRGRACTINSTNCGARLVATAKW